MGAGNCPCDENDYPETDAIEGWDYKVDTPPPGAITADHEGC